MHRGVNFVVCPTLQTFARRMSHAVCRSLYNVSVAQEQVRHGNVVQKDVGLGTMHVRSKNRDHELQNPCNAKILN